MRHETTQTNDVAVTFTKREQPLSPREITAEREVRVGASVDALVMRAGLGAEINHHLVQAMLPSLIIVAPRTSGARPDDWIFLTQPRTPLRRQALDDLAAMNVGWYAIGDSITLPGARHAEGLPRWLREPDHDTQLPPWSAVVAAVRRSCARMW